MEGLILAVFFIGVLIIFMLKYAKAEKRRKQSGAKPKSVLKTFSDSIRTQESFLVSFKYHYDKQEYEAALKVAENIYEADYDFYQKLGWINFKVGNAERGGKLYRKSLASTNLDFEKDYIRADYGIRLFYNKDYRQAIKMLQEVTPDTLKEWKSAYNNDYTVPYYKGKSFMELGKYELAISAFKEAPVNKKEPNEELIEIISLIGECYDKLGKTKQAITWYNKALAHDFSLEGISERVEELEA